MKQNLYQLFVPKRIKDKIYQMNLQQCLLEETRRREAIEKELPHIELSPIYIENLKILANLNELVRKMPKNAIIAEFGVEHGELSERIISICQPSKLYLLNNRSESFRRGDYSERLRIKFKEEIQSGVVEFNDGEPIIELEKIPDGTLDWIYLRSDNSYQKTASLLEISLRKVKTSGIISGANYGIGHWKSMQRYGVIDAVNKFCKDNGWEIIYLTNEGNRLLNFALRKISQDQ